MSDPLPTQNGPTDSSKSLKLIQTLVKAAAVKAQLAVPGHEYNPEEIDRVVAVIFGFLENRLGSDLTSGVAAYATRLIAQQKLSGQTIDGILQAVRGIRAKVDFGQLVHDFTIYTLWHGIPHPPPTHMGREFEFRTADGSNNNIWLPRLGAAHQPYSRTTASRHPLPISMLPDPEMIWNTMLKREKADNPHPNGVSSLLFGFAAVIIHTLFKTNLKQRNINETSSYLDLAPVYGDNQAMQDSVRNKDGYGRLYQDVFAEDRLFSLPPAATALLILFSRNHNWIAEQLFHINERGNWKDPKTLSDVVPPPDPTNPDRKMKSPRELQDDEIFNIARLVNCGWFVHIILTDYLGTIIGTYMKGQHLSLNPTLAFRDLLNVPVDRGTGNSVSAEFNMMYRWHAPLSLKDTEETEAMFRKYFPKANWDTISIPEFVAGLSQLNPNPDPRKRDLPTGLTRDPKTGRVDDNGLAKVFQDATDNVAQAFGAKNIPAAMRIIEVLGIEEGRSWGLPSLNEFRKFFGMKPYKSFEEWNPAVAKDAQRLYRDIDNLELYPGLIAEQAKVEKGLSLGETTGRGILVDAAALVRGDRHYTIDFTPSALTTFGFSDCAFPPTGNGAFGGMLGQLLFRHLPRHYPVNSVYAHFPFVTPTQIKGVLRNLKLDSLYNFDRPPTPTSSLAMVNKHSVAKRVLDSFESFRVTYGPAMEFLTTPEGSNKGYGFFLGWDDKEGHNRDKDMMRTAMFQDPQLRDRWLSFFHSKTKSLLETKSYTMSGYTGKFVDIVQEVLNLVPIYWASNCLTGLPVGTEALSEQEAFYVYATIFSFTFRNNDPQFAALVREAAAKANAKLTQATKAQLSAANSNRTATDGEPESLAFCRRLLETAPDRNHDELAYNIMSCAVGGAAIFAHATVQVLNVYLDDAHRTERENIIRIAKLDTVGPEDQRLLEGYVREGMRLDPQAPLVNRLSVVQDQEVGANPGDIVIVSLRNAMMDPTVFHNPEKIDPHRPEENYLYLGHGMHTCLGKEFVIKAMPEMLRAVFRLPNIRRAAGPKGHFHRYQSDTYGTPLNVYIDDKGMPSGWPSSMILQYDSA